MSYNYTNHNTDFISNLTFEQIKNKTPILVTRGNPNNSAPSSITRNESSGFFHDMGLDYVGCVQ